MRLAERSGVCHMPKHCGWLNMAETGINVLSRQCFGRRILSRGFIVREIGVWQRHGNLSAKPVD